MRSGGFVWDRRGLLAGVCGAGDPVDHFPSELLLAFAAVVTVLIAIPGPSVLFTISRALTVGRRAALLTVVGNELLGLRRCCWS